MMREKFSVQNNYGFIFHNPCYCWISSLVSPQNCSKNSLMVSVQKIWYHNQFRIGIKFGFDATLKKPMENECTDTRKITPTTVSAAGLRKENSLHPLRHSVVYPAICGATHLLEAGTDLWFIRSLLGHSRITTSTIYTHLTNNGADRIQSTLDRLVDAAHWPSKKGTAAMLFRYAKNK